MDKVQQSLQTQNLRLTARNLTHFADTTSCQNTISRCEKIGDARGPRPSKESRWRIAKETALVLRSPQFISGINRGRHHLSKGILHASIKR